MMEFPLDGLVEMNSSEMASGQGGSLYSRKPVVAVPYIGVLAVAAVVGTFGNLVVITAVTIKYLRSRRQRSQTAGNDVGKALIANLALSDLIVTAIINPVAIAGSCIMCIHVYRCSYRIRLILLLICFSIYRHTGVVVHGALESGSHFPQLSVFVFFLHNHIFLKNLFPGISVVLE